MLLGDLLLACLMFWISIMRAASSELDGDRDSNLSAGSDACARWIKAFTTMQCSPLFRAVAHAPCSTKHATSLRKQEAYEHIQPTEASLQCLGRTAQRYLL